MLKRLISHKKLIGNVRLLASCLGFALAFICILLSLTFVLLTDQIISIAISVYSRNGVVTSTGYNLITETLTRAKLAFALFGFAFLLFALILRAAEQTMIRVRRDPVYELSLAKEGIRIGGVTTIIVVVLCVLRAAIGTTHLGDSLWCDELFTVKNYGLGSIYSIFGISKSNLPNNHILNSLLVKFTLILGFKSEVSLRVWSFIASILTIPAACYLGIVLRLKQSSLLLLLAMVATSPIIDRYGSQARGYGLAVLLATLSVALHLDCFSRPGKTRFSALMLVNTLLVLANMFTIPLVLGEILHLLMEALYPKSQARMYGYSAYNRHLFSLILSFVCALAFHVFLLPFIFLNSIVFASKEPFSPLVISQIVSGTLTPHGNLVLGCALIIILAVYGTVKKAERFERRASMALFSVLSCGIGATILSHIYELRAVAYLNVLVVITIVLAESYLRHWRLSLLVTSALAVCVCVWGVYSSIHRPPIQDYRGMIIEAERLANGRRLWTSGFASEGIEYYGRVSTPTEPPSQPSIYLSFFDWEVKNDDLQKIVWGKCWIKNAHPSELKMAIYECP